MFRVQICFFLMYNAFVLLKYPCLPIDYLFFHSATPIFLGATPNLKSGCSAKKNRCGARKCFVRSALCTRLCKRIAHCALDIASAFRICRRAGSLSSPLTLFLLDACRFIFYLSYNDDIQYRSNVFMSNSISGQFCYIE